MLRRLAIFALIIQQFCWLNLVLPGHTRGRYTVGCESTAADAHSGGCCATRHAPGDRSTPPTPGDRAHCAVCFVALGTCAAPPVLCAPPPPAPLRMIDVPAPLAAPSVDLPPVYYGRAPPVVA
jgi:hypothetical protein